MQNSVFAAVADPQLRGYAVWVPKSGGQGSDVPTAAQRIPDVRNAHYWDDRAALMAAYTKVLKLPEDAWDIYMIYGRNARWDGALPPKPKFWMHQLGSRDKPRVPGPFLQSSVFTARVNAALAEPGR
ncbi:MAG: hypothetical protein AAGC55_25710 [Myxococcota bacterium]